MFLRTIHPLSKPLYIVVALFLLLLVVDSSTPAYAYGPLEPSSNVTEYIMTDNFTITLQGGDTITGLEDAMTTAGEASAQLLADSLEDRLGEIISFLLPVFLMVIAVWRRTWLFYVLAGFAWLLYGFGYWGTNHYMSLILVMVGICCFAGAKWDQR